MTSGFPLNKNEPDPPVPSASASSCAWRIARTWLCTRDASTRPQLPSSRGRHPVALVKYSTAPPASHCYDAAQPPSSTGGFLGEDIPSVLFFVYFKPRLQRWGYSECVKTESTFGGYLDGVGIWMVGYYTISTRTLGYNRCTCSLALIYILFFSHILLVCNAQ